MHGIVFIFSLSLQYIRIKTVDRRINKDGVNYTIVGKQGSSWLHYSSCNGLQGSGYGNLGSVLTLSFLTLPTRSKQHVTADTNRPYTIPYLQYLRSVSLGSVLYPPLIWNFDIHFRSSYGEKGLPGISKSTKKNIRQVSLKIQINPSVM